MRMASLRDLYQRQLAALRQTETAYLQALPTLRNAASSPELADTLKSHVRLTREHVQRLNKLLDSGPASMTSTSLGEGTFELGYLDPNRHPEASPAVRDSAIIAAIQRAEHDQIAGYGCARTWAQALGDNAARVILQECLTEEKDCDAELSRIANNTNHRAAAVLAVV